MTSRQAGRRIGAIATKRKSIGRQPRGGIRQTTRKQNTSLSKREKRRFLQLVACGSMFVLLVAVKLLLPAKMTQFNQWLSGALAQNMDVRAVFSAVGQAVTGEKNVGGTLEDVYQAVFHPQDEEEEMEPAVLTGATAQFQEPSPMETLRAFQTGEVDSFGWLDEPAQATESVSTQSPAETTPAPVEAPPPAETETNVSTLAYILYSDQNLPTNVSLEQSILGFDYTTPVLGPLTSNFGYRQHPVEGEERFHYGLDIAADTGTAIGSFADGTVTAVGESSSYGKYCIVDHAGGYSTLYAHCSRITATSGTAVREGEKLAEVGETGIATGPHLHFELHREETYLNPIYYVKLA